MVVITTSVDCAGKIQSFIGATLMQIDDPESLGNEEALLGSGILDSLGIMRLVVFLEEEFGIAVAETALVPEHFQTVTSLVAFVVYELRVEDPVVDLRVFKERSYAVGVFLMTVVGFVLYGSLVLLPIMLQTLLL